MHKRYSSSERVAPGRINLANLLPLVAVLLLAPYNFLRAQSSPAAVQASYTPGSPVNSNQVVTLSAAVGNGSTPVTSGTVTFYEGNTLLGTVHVNLSGVATLNYLFPPNGGSYEITARYNGSVQAGPATSPFVGLVVLQTLSVSLTSSGSSSAYNLTAAVTTNNSFLPQGPTTFTDTTTGQTLGTVNLTNQAYQSPVSITPTLGDFNGDGRIDTVLAFVDASGQATEQVQVNLTNADGSATQVVSQPFGASQDSYQLLAVGDFNNDGDTDLLVQDVTTDVLTVLLSQGNGQFSVAGQISLPSAVTAAVVGDFNNDGNLDLIANGSSPIEFYAGDGAGHLAAGQAIDVTAPAAALVADYNLDGFLDFFSFSPDEDNGFAGTSLYLGAGNGTAFAEQPQSIFAGYAPPSSVSSMVSGEFCNTGNVDIAYANSSSVTILCGDGKGDFNPPAGGGQFVYDIGSHVLVRLVAADVNADEYEDIVAFVQDEAQPNAPWNMIALTSLGGDATFTVSAEASSAGNQFPNTPVAFASPVLGESLTSLSPPWATIPFLAAGTTSTAAATLSNVVLRPGNNTIVANDGEVDSNAIQLTGSTSGNQGPSIGSLDTPNGSATISNGVLQLTDGGTFEAGSAFTSNAVDVQSFTTTFTFQLIDAQADGFTFTVQNVSPQALGGNGGMLGYEGIPNSIALKFDLYNNAGEGNDSTGVFTNGADPTVPATDMTSSGVNLHSGDVMQARLIYDGANLHVTITDTSTNAVFQQTYPIDIPQTIGSTTAYVGFTGATGSLTATQQILTWSFAPLPYYPNFSNAPSLLLNGGAAVVGTNNPSLQIVDGGTYEARSAWFTNPVPIGQFTNDFTFTASNAVADGITFTIQNAGPAALGPAGGGLGYGPDTPGEPVGITNSMCIKFDLYDNQGEGNDSTGIYTYGDSPTVPAIDLSSTGINLHSSDPVHAHMVYDGATLTVTLTDTTTNATAQQVYYGVYLQQLVGASTAYVGFTGGTGGLTASEDIQGWTYLPTNTITSPVSTY